MVKGDVENWVDLIDKTDFEVDEDAPTTYQSYRFVKLDINEVTVDNYKKLLVDSLAIQVEPFVPPIGSFETPDLRRYLELICSYETSTTDLMMGLSLADQIRLTFSDMRTSTICDRYPDIGLAEKRRYRCVAEYLSARGSSPSCETRTGSSLRKSVICRKPWSCTSLCRNSSRP